MVMMPINVVIMTPVEAKLTPEFPLSVLKGVWKDVTAARDGKNGFTVRLEPWQTAVFKAE